MPIPKPNKDEKKKDFIARCMSDEAMVKEYDQEQRAAICNTSWKESKEKKVEKQSVTIKPMTDFKYFVKIEKAFEEEGEWYVEGVASGTKEDLEDGRMAKSALQKFVDGLPLPLTDNHAKGDVLAELGQVVEAKVMDNDELFIKAKLDKENPAIPYFVKKVGEGKKFAFSVEGLLKKAKTVFSEKLDRFITEYIDIEPIAISITTQPAYEASFLQVVAKSYEDYQDNIKKEQEMKEEKVVQNTEEVTEEISTTESTEQSEAAVEEKNDEKDVQPSQEVAEEADSKQTEEVTTSEEAEEEAEESQEASGVEQLQQQINDLNAAIQRLSGEKPEAKVVEQVVPEKTVAEQAVSKILEKQNVIVKRLIDRVETLEKMPLQKKTKAKLPVIEKTVEDDGPKSLEEVAEKFI